MRLFLQNPVTNAVDPRLSKLNWTWVCSDNWKARIIHLYTTELDSNTLIKRTSLTNTLIEQSLLSPDNPSGQITRSLHT